METQTIAFTLSTKTPYLEEDIKELQHIANLNDGDLERLVKSCSRLGFNTKEFNNMIDLARLGFRIV